MTAIQSIQFPYVIPSGPCLIGLPPNHDTDLASKVLGNIIKTSLCWEYQGNKHKYGYGMLRHDRRKLFAHRASWLLHYGSIPPNINVLHKCDNPPCVRPDHLFLGTNGDNWRDACAKRRAWMFTHPEKQPRGERSGTAKLTEKAVIEIYGQWQKGAQQKALARTYNVSKFAIYSIVHQKTWKHVTYILGAMPPGTPPTEGTTPCAAAATTTIPASSM